MRVACEQVSFFGTPTRLALMRSHIAKVLPFSGYDSYRDGRGEMVINVAGIFNVGHASGPHMDASALVTFLAEGMLMPFTLVHPHVHWSTLSHTSARATIHDGSVTVGGVFTFDDDRGRVRFETNDRWREGTPGKFEPWSAEASDYTWRHGTLVPSTVSARWHDSDGSFTYMRGSVESLTYDVTDTRTSIESRRQSGLSLRRSLDSLGGE